MKKPISGIHITAIESSAVLVDDASSVSEESHLRVCPNYPETTTEARSTPRVLTVTITALASEGRFRPGPCQATYSNLQTVIAPDARWTATAY